MANNEAQKRAKNEIKNIIRNKEKRLTTLLYMVNRQPQHLTSKHLF